MCLAPIDKGATGGRITCQVGVVIDMDPDLQDRGGWGFLFIQSIDLATIIIEGGVPW